MLAVWCNRVTQARPCILIYSWWIPTIEILPGWNWSGDIYNWIMVNKRAWGAGIYRPSRIYPLDAVWVGWGFYCTASHFFHLRNHKISLFLQRFLINLLWSNYSQRSNILQRLFTRTASTSPLLSLRSGLSRIPRNLWIQEARCGNLLLVLSVK